MKIGFIGGGNMAQAIIAGMVKNDWQPEAITVADPNQRQLDKIKNNFGVSGFIDNRQLVNVSDVIILAVKPQLWSQVAQPLSQLAQAKKPLVLSIMAGIKIASISRYFGDRIIRTMPNTPALVGAGITALYAQDGILDTQRDIANQIMQSIGATIWLADEAQMDAVTAVSGSGPAYFYFIMDKMINAAVDLGLDHASAKLLVQQTAKGAAEMALCSTVPLQTLMTNVTSPGGTTEKALAVYHNSNLAAILTDAITAAHQRSIELSRELDK